MKKITAFVFGLGFLLCTVFAFAVDVHFRWDASTGQVDGYRIYYGHSPGDVAGGSYPEQLCEVNGTTLDYVVSLSEAQEYYLVCRAFNVCGESGDSNELHWPCSVPGIPGTFQQILLRGQFEIISQ